MVIKELAGVECIASPAMESLLKLEQCSRLCTPPLLVAWRLCSMEANAMGAPPAFSGLPWHTPLLRRIGVLYRRSLARQLLRC